MSGGRFSGKSAKAITALALFLPLALVTLRKAPASSAQVAQEPSSTAGSVMAPSTAGCRQAKGDNASVPGRDAASTANKVVVVAQHNL